ncbi:hypothetical protein KSP39_PZI016131 [Platanthera zijinensis]|uniref:Uncharacterized protein n=1 Tax=Platanthera zijinensis TaxID=2320716 RepID=A0AAP0G0V7_9ASPA
MSMGKALFPSTSSSNQVKVEFLVMESSGISPNSWLIKTGMSWIAMLRLLGYLIYVRTCRDRLGTTQWVTCH